MKRSFTLIELLVSVAIFAGLVVIMMATFARSTNALTSTAGLREKSQIARSTIDSIGNDFRYLYLKNEQGPVAFRWAADGIQAGGVTDHYGFAVNQLGSEAYLVLLYPGDTKLTFKHYQIESSGNPPRPTLTLEEGRGCRLAGVISRDQQSSCDSSPKSDLISEKWSLDSAGSQKSFFSETPITQSSAGYLTVSLNIRPKEYAGVSCGSSSMPAGVCFAARTTFTQGLK